MLRPRSTPRMPSSGGRTRPTPRKPRWTPWRTLRRSGRRISRPRASYSRTSRLLRVRWPGPESGPRRPRRRRQRLRRIGLACWSRWRASPIVGCRPRPSPQRRPGVSLPRCGLRAPGSRSALRRWPPRSPSLRPSLGISPLTRRWQPRRRTSRRLSPRSPGPAPSWRGSTTSLRGSSPPKRSPTWSGWRCSPGISTRRWRRVGSARTSSPPLLRRWQPRRARPGPRRP